MMKKLLKDRLVHFVASDAHDSNKRAPKLLECRNYVERKFGEEYAKWGAKYSFSGHVHGGSVRLFGKALLSPERRFFPKYAKGVYDFGDKKLLVSAGLGKLRLFDPPEIVIYDI